MDQGCRGAGCLALSAGACEYRPSRGRLDGKGSGQMEETSFVAILPLLMLLGATGPIMLGAAVFYVAIPGISG